MPDRHLCFRLVAGRPGRILAGSRLDGGHRSNINVIETSSH
jgi:hypothetical protein